MNSAEYLAAIEETEIRSKRGEFVSTPPTDDRPRSTGFPLHALPDGMRWLAEHLRDTAGFPADYLSCSLLYATSVATGTTMLLSPRQDWNEAGVMWLALVGRPGANKSHPLSWALRPLYRRDALLAEEYRVASKEHLAAVRATKQVETAELPPEPVFVQHLIGDTTPEALVEALVNNPRGLGLHRDELAAWVADFGRYSTGGDAERFLSMWSLVPVLVNRKTDRKPRRAERPFVSVVGTIQPGVLGTLVGNGRGVNGFMDRILFAYPEDATARRWSLTDTDPQASRFWSAAVDRMLALRTPQGEVDTPVLRFTPDAQDLWQQHHDRLIAEVNRFNADGDEARAGYRTKLLSYTLRLALLQTAARWAESSDPAPPTYVDRVALTASIALVEYFSTTADRVLFALNESTPVDALGGRKRRLFDALPSTPFTTAQAIVIGQGLEIAQRSVERYLGDTRIYDRDRGRGQYLKRT